MNIVGWNNCAPLLFAGFIWKGAWDTFVWKPTGKMPSSHDNLQPRKGWLLAMLGGCFSIFYSDNAERDWTWSDTAHQVFSPKKTFTRYVNTIKMGKTHVKVKDMTHFYPRFLQSSVLEFLRRCWNWNWCWHWSRCPLWLRLIGAHALAPIKSGSACHTVEKDFYLKCFQMQKLFYVDGSPQYSSWYDLMS